MADYIIQKAIDRKDMSAKAVKAMASIEYDIQPKYDGCHMVVVLNCGPAGNTIVEGLFSATGETVRSCDHIARQLADCVEVFARTAICGEVWRPDSEFKDISGEFRRHSPQPALMFAAFDVVSVPEYEDGIPHLDSMLPYRLRITALQHPSYKGANLVQFQHCFADHVNADAYALTMKNDSYDGAIMHDLNAPYAVGRCRAAEVVKIKPLLDYDLRVIGCTLDHGEKTGKKTAALLCKFGDRKVVKVATGLTQAQVDSIHNNFNAEWWDKIIRVEAMAITKNGVLREPRFKGVRTDKKEADFE